MVFFAEGPLGWLAAALVVLVAIEHFGFMILEMFLWTKPFGLKAFRQSLAQATASKALAANQGLYNGFLSAGLLWAAMEPHPVFARRLSAFFLGLVVVAGGFGAWTVSRRILYVQALPAAIALAALWAGA